MRMISVYSEAGMAKVCVERWNGEKHKKKRYHPSQASLDRLAEVVDIWRLRGKIWVRPFLGSCIGYVAEEGEMWTLAGKA